MPNPADRPDPALPPGEPGGARSDTPSSAVPTQPASVTPIPEMPAFIGPYRVVAFLGVGGQGTVFRAAHPTLARDVAVKLASRDLSAAQRECLFAEGRVLARLDDPGLVRVYDANVHDGRPYVVFEFVHGRSLADRVRGTSLPPREAVALVATLAAILERVHRAGVLHRDLKPANVLIDAAGNPRLMDFGSALLGGPYADAAAAEELSGTPSYMPPEQANGAADRVGPATDVFGLAGVLYHLLTGSPPYPGTSCRAVWDLARTGRVPPVAERNPATPPALARILDKALAADPADRYQTADAFGRALGGYLWRPVRRLAFAVAAVALLAAGVLLVPRAWRDRAANPLPAVGAAPGPVAREVAPRPRLKGWREYRPRGEYAVLFPAEPRLSDAKTEDKGHPARLAQAADANGTGFAVAVSPHLDPAPTTQAALRARRDELLNLQGAVLTSEREVTHGGHPGAEASALVQAGPLQGHWLRVRVVLAGDQFYVLAVMGRAPHRPDAADADWFFDSFRLLGTED